MFVVDAKIIREEFEVLQVGLGSDISSGITEFLSEIKEKILKNSIWIPDADDKEIGESSRLHMLRGR